MLKIERRLRELVGLPLSAARRAADMATFQFGTIKAYRGGTVGDFALHIQCPWRLENPLGIVTGRQDLWRPEDETVIPDPRSWDYDENPNLLDARLKSFLHVDRRGVIHPESRRSVRGVRADSYGGFVLLLSGRCRLVVFPAGCTGEHWRFFRTGSDAPHFVVPHEGVKDKQ